LEQLFSEEVEEQSLGVRRPLARNRVQNVCEKILVAREDCFQIWHALEKNLEKHQKALYAARGLFLSDGSDQTAARRNEDVHLGGLLNNVFQDD
jgi:hypothetical protein